MRKIVVLALCSLFLVPAFSAKRKVHTIGDSTMSNYKPAATPKRGWGMYLQAFFNPDSVEVNNRGKSGASTRTFYETENLWASVKQQMSAGDYLIIQFAHNDEKCKGEDVYVHNNALKAIGQDTVTDMRGTDPNTTYKTFLRAFINEAREMGVTPVLMSPICRAYFKEGKINDEGRHVLSHDMNYVRSMCEVAYEMNVPLLDMTTKTKEIYEKEGKEYCMEHYFNCGDKTHTGREGGMMIASLAAKMIQHADELHALSSYMITPTEEEYQAYADRIENGEVELPVAKSAVTVKQNLETPAYVANLEVVDGIYYIAKGGAWPAGEVDEVSNRYLEYRIKGHKSRDMILNELNLSVYAKGGSGMNIHINYGFGKQFRDVTTVYENTALPKNEVLPVHIKQAIKIPAGEVLVIRILPWYDSNGKPQGKKYINVSTLKAKLSLL